MLPPVPRLVWRGRAGRRCEPYNSCSRTEMEVWGNFTWFLFPPGNVDVWDADGTCQALDWNEWLYD